MSDVHVCPSGLKLRTRKLKVADTKLFADAKLRKEGRTMQALLGACVEKVIDPGIYELGSPPDWDRLVQGDLFYMFLMLRVQTYGPMYDYELFCPSCSKRSVGTVDLNALEVHYMPDEVKAAYAAGQGIMREIPGIPPIAFKVVSVGDEKKIEQLAKGTGMSHATASLAYRIGNVEGVGNSPAVIAKWYENLDADVAEGIAEAAAEMECGVITVVDHVCEHCGADGRLDVPFGGNFFQSRKKN